jgi:ABC-type dipeptide/oligopeptide/nickel transport system permease component
MWQYAARRILLLAPTLLAVYTIVFVLFHATPGGPWDGEKPVSDRVKEQLDAKYGLDKPLWQQYGDYLVRVATRLDLGPSYHYTSRTVNDIIRAFFPNSLRLGLLAMALAIAVGIPAGAVAALEQNTWIDRTLMALALLGATLPSFIVGPLLVWGVVLALPDLGIDLGLPTGGWGEPRHLVLPAATLAIGPAAIVARYTRAALVEVIHMEYILTARAKGLHERVVVLRHALKNALIPVTTVVGVLFAVVITGSFYVEFIFSVPGIGQSFVAGVTNRDYPVLMGVTLLFATVMALVNLAVDLVYGLLDPRIRYQ